MQTGLCRFASTRVMSHWTTYGDGLFPKWKVFAGTHTHLMRAGALCTVNFCFFAPSQTALHVILGSCSISDFWTRKHSWLATSILFPFVPPDTEKDPTWLSGLDLPREAFLLRLVTCRKGDMRNSKHQHVRWIYANEPQYYAHPNVNWVILTIQ